MSRRCQLSFGGTNAVFYRRQMCRMFSWPHGGRVPVGCNCNLGLREATGVERMLPVPRACNHEASRFARLQPRGCDCTVGLTIPGSNRYCIRGWTRAHIETCAVLRCLQEESGWWRIWSSHLYWFWECQDLRQIIVTILLHASNSRRRIVVSWRSDVSVLPWMCLSSLNEDNASCWSLLLIGV